MFVTKKHLSRRTMLRGVGVSLGLPLLDSMVAAQTRLSQTAAPKSRFAAIEIVHGAAGSTAEGADKHYWMPEREGRDFDFSFSLKPLEPYRDYVTVIGNTDAANAEAKSPREAGADHFRSSAVLLSGAHPKQTEGSDVYCGTTIDQLYAQQYGQDTPLPSLQLCIENVAAAGACDFHYSCVYRDTISWSSPTTPLPMTLDPRMAFESLVGDGGSVKDRANRQKENKSILDAIMQDTARLGKKIDAQDRARLNTYLDNIREVERRIEEIERYNAANPNRELPAAPIGVPDSWEDHVKLMFDLQVIAFAADITRVSAFKLGRDLSDRVFTQSGVTTPFHTASHHKDSPARIAEYAKLNQYHVGIVTYFLDKLKNTPDGDGNLLDHSLVLYGSPMGDSNVHAHKRVPLVLMGHASGALKGNLNVRAKDGTPQANALLAVINTLGIDQSSIGDSTGVVTI